MNTDTKKSEQKICIGKTNSFQAIPDLQKYKPKWRDEKYH